MNYTFKNRSDIGNKQSIGLIYCKSTRKLFKIIFDIKTI